MCSMVMLKLLIVKNASKSHILSTDYSFELFLIGVYQ